MNKHSEAKIDKRTRAIKGPKKTNSKLHNLHDPYWVQTLKVGTEYNGKSREEVFTGLLKGKSVLHVGYADWPITDVSANLHVQLDKVCKRIDGIDPHEEADSVLRPLVKGKFFHSWREVKGRYDILLAPEVMEHVDNVRLFLEDLDKAPAKQIIITVPDAIQCRNAHFDFDDKSNSAIEVVHPDHNYWFSPYTLSNLVTKYTDWNIKGLWQINNISIMIIADKPRFKILKNK